MDYIEKQKRDKNGRRVITLKPDSIKNINDIRFFFKEIYAMGYFNSEENTIYVHVYWDDAMQINNSILVNQQYYSVLGKHLVFVLKDN